MGGEAFSVLRILVLERNHIGDIGMRALADAILLAGAFPSLVESKGAAYMHRSQRHQHIFLMGNPGGDAIVHDAISKVRSRRSHTQPLR